ncbi:uncharacterized protein BDV17DRAFT_231229 [Aspergillus undulatus]|uniref:uncharacterized protein n=1 Tax=Aspergillus undulatus TaxID=1810928 RepID=UPI003CCDDF3C
MRIILQRSDWQHGRSRQLIAGIRYINDSRRLRKKAQNKVRCISPSCSPSKSYRPLLCQRISDRPATLIVYALTRPFILYPGWFFGPYAVATYAVLYFKPELLFYLRQEDAPIDSKDT